VQAFLGEHFVGGISNNYKLVREAVDRGVPLHEIDPNANVVNDLRRIVLPDEIVAETRKKRSLFGLGKSLLRRAG
ncbi:MAG: response regulator receiver protein, partial [Mesorhizobium sp.]